VDEKAITTEGDLSEARALYTECGYGGGLCGSDTIIVAEANGRAVGAVRICLESGYTVLRGMQVLPNF